MNEKEDKKNSDYNSNKNGSKRQSLFVYEINLKDVQTEINPLNIISRQMADKYHIQVSEELKCASLRKSPIFEIQKGQLKVSNYPCPPISIIPQITFDKIHEIEYVKRNKKGKGSHTLKSGNNLNSKLKIESFDKEDNEIASSYRNMIGNQIIEVRSPQDSDKYDLESSNGEKLIKNVNKVRNLYRPYDKGIINLGNTCYMYLLFRNSVLQCLIHSQEFVQELMEIKYDPKYILLNEFQVFILSTFQINSTKICNPKRIKQIIGRLIRIKKFHFWPK